MYDGFVVLHGTDTLAYTASALSFMLENLSKTVVVTGSQIPLNELRNDAVDNLVGSLIVAGHFNIPEVVVFFSSKLMRGNRCTKESTWEMGGFNSPNLGYLGTMGVSFDTNWDLIMRHNNQGQMKVQKISETEEICLLNISPLLNLKAIRMVIQASKAIILEAYGMGNVPS